jgi:arginyl-tRNA--protein-N-Asp/Glu arginylyltransferase
VKFGVTQAFKCSYLANTEEQLLVCMEESDKLLQQYPLLIQAGFRRSGEQLYRPHCKSCNACESLRILARDFTPSKSQKRVLSKNTNIISKVLEGERDDYYPLYEKYISIAHKDGAMFPPTYEQYRSFIHCHWQSPIFIEGRINGKLVGVAVTDKVSIGLSALYTFFDPSLHKQSLGTYFILQQIQLCQQLDMEYLYLGYQIDKCAKMNYKNKFYPHQRFQNNHWVLFSKKDVQSR